MYIFRLQISPSWIPRVWRGVPGGGGDLAWPRGPARPCQHPPHPPAPRPRQGRAACLAKVSWQVIQVEKWWSFGTLTPFISGSWSTSQGWWSGGNLAVIASLSFSVWVQYTDCFSGSQWRQWLSTSSRHLTRRVGDIISSIQTTGLMLIRTTWRDLSSKSFPEAINLPKSGTPS